MRALAGEAPITGRLPIALPGMFEAGLGHRDGETIMIVCAPLAQMDRAPGYEPGGRRFESCRARHFAPRPRE